MDLILKSSGRKPPQYVVSECNPADVATRPFHIGQVERWKLWMRGPAFLWDSHLDLNSMGKFSNSKTVKHANIASLCIASITGDAKKTRSDGFLQHTLDRTNKLSKVLQMVCNVAKCFWTWKEQLKNRSHLDSGPTKNLTDLRVAKLAMIHGAQKELFGEILKYMQPGHTFDDALATSKEECSLSPHHIKKYILFIDPEGILHVGGQMKYAEGIEDKARHPAYLPQEHRAMRLFIINHHKKLGHRAGETVLVSLCPDEGIQPTGGI